MSFAEARDRLVKGALVGSAVSLGGVCVLAVALGLVIDGAMIEQPDWLLAGYLILVAAVSAVGGWVAGSVAGTQPFVAAAFTAIILGVGGFALGYLLTALVQDPGWVGTAVAGVAPAGALLGGLIRWSGTDEEI